MREHLIGKASAQIAMLDARLDKQSKEFLRGEWHNKNELVDVCRSMDATVEDRELCRWKIDVWNRKQEPFHEVQHGRTTSKVKSTAPHATPGLLVHPNDRLSVEPAPRIDEEPVFKTPRASPQPSDDHIDAGDGMDVNPSLDAPSDDFIEGSPHPLPGSPVNVSRSTPGAESPQSDQVTPPTASDSESDGLPAVSSFVKPLPLKPEPKSVPSEVIDLCSDSSSTSSKKRKKAKVSKSAKVSKKAQEAEKKALEAEFARAPTDATVAEVRGWNPDDLIERNDRQRLLIKLLAEAGQEMRKALQKCLTSLRRPAFSEKLVDALHRLKADLKDVGSNPQENTMIVCARIYLAYFFLVPSLQHDTTTKGIDWTRILHDKGSRVVFVNLLEPILQKSDSKLFVSPKTKSKAEVNLVTDSEDDEDVLKNTPSKRKRKQKLQQRTIFQESQALEKTALLRAEKFTKVVETQSSNMESGTPGKSTIQINISKEDDQEAIFVNKKIAKHMMPHQVRGVQFMWRELTALDDKGHAQGCVLAHTMGLGKTMQTITVLIALNEAARSDEPAVYKQLPKDLRRARKEGRQLRILVLCPASLLNNWSNEIEHWARDKLSSVFVVDVTCTKAQQKHRIEDWHEYGGVLLIGYSLFQNKMPLDEKQLKARKRAAAERDADLTDKLLDGAEVVVADEAHMIKNPTAGITKSAQRFKTISRIALTGTPMSNDVTEIYSLISWVAPKYLGDPAWFNFQYAKPIKEGNGKDSTHYEIRRGIKKLRLLHRKIGPKVDRATIAVLKGSLGSKVEFHITLPLTATQTTAYNKYVKALLGGDGLEKASQVAIFGWLALLTLLTNHPLAFKQKLLTPPKPRATRTNSREVTPGDTDGSVTPVQGAEDEEDEADAGRRSLQFSKEVIDDIVSGIADDDHHALSVKMTIVMEIVRLSKACGDKLLIFTHGLASLDYMAELFRKQGVSFGRIDGNILAQKRLLTLKDFENGRHDLMIISTRAGGTGLNIQTANRVIILDAHFNPALEEQAIGRAYRLGQTKPVFVYRLVSGGTFETNIWNKQVFKTSMSLRVVDKKTVKRNADHNSREYLYESRDPKQENVSQYVGTDPFVFDRILEDDGAGALVRQIETTETLQEEVVEQLTEEENREVEEEWLQERALLMSGKTLMDAPPSTAPAQVRGKAPAAGFGFVPAQNRDADQQSRIVRLPNMAQAAMMFPPRLPPKMPNGLPDIAPASTMPPRPN